VTRHFEVDTNVSFEESTVSRCTGLFFTDLIAWCFHWPPFCVKTRLTREGLNQCYIIFNWSVVLLYDVRGVKNDIFALYNMWIPPIDFNSTWGSPVWLEAMSGRPRIFRAFLTLEDEMSSLIGSLQRKLSSWVSCLSRVTHVTWQVTTAQHRQHHNTTIRCSQAIKAKV